MFMSLSTMSQWHCILPNINSTSLARESRVALKRKDRNNEYNQTIIEESVMWRTEIIKDLWQQLKLHGMSIDYFKSGLNEVTVKLSVLTV